MFPAELTAPTQAIYNHWNSAVLGSMTMERVFLI